MITLLQILNRFAQMGYTKAECFSAIAAMSSELVSPKEIFLEAGFIFNENKNVIDRFVEVSKKTKSVQSAIEIVYLKQENK